MTANDYSVAAVAPAAGDSLAANRLVRYAIAAVVAAAVLVPPLVVLEQRSSSESVEVVITLAIAFVVVAIGHLVCMSFFAEAARAPERTVQLVRRMWLRSYELVVPIVVLVVVGAHWSLGFIREEYAEHASGLLRILAVSMIPAITTTTFISVARAQKRTMALLVMTGAMSVSVLTISTLLLSRLGIAAVGWAWLLTQTLAATTLLLGDLLTLWLVPLPLRRLGRGAARGAAVMPAERVARRSEVRAAVGELGVAPSALLADNGDVYVLAVPATVQQPDAVLRVAHSEVGQRVLTSSATVLREIETGGAFASVPRTVPRLLSGSASPGAWTLETKCEGVSPARLDLDQHAVDRLLVEVGERIAMLHRATATLLSPPAATPLHDLQALVARTTIARPSLMRAASDQHSRRKLYDELSDVLGDRPLTTAYVHGDLWLGNVVCDPHTATLTGIVDWDCAGRGLPAVELMLLVCTTRAWRGGAQLGAVVRRLLEREDWRDVELDVIQRSVGGAELPLRALLLLGWLTHVDANLKKSSTISQSSVWVAHNVLQVLEAV